MKGGSIRITRHAVERWRQRVDPAADDEQAEQALREALARAEELCDAEDGAKAYLSDGLVLIVAQNGALATVCRPEYGFGDAIDRSIAEQLITQLHEVRARRARWREQSAPRLRALDERIRATEDEIRVLQATVERLKLERQALEAEDREMAEAEHAIAQRLYRSIDYRIDLLAARFSKTG